LRDFVGGSSFIFFFDWLYNVSLPKFTLNKKREKNIFYNHFKNEIKNTKKNENIIRKICQKLKNLLTNHWLIKTT